MSEGGVLEEAGWFERGVQVVLLGIIGVLVMYIIRTLFTPLPQTPTRVAPPPPQPQHVLTPSRLLLHDGTREGVPLLVGVGGKVFDVSSGREHYGPSGAYAALAGKDASRALATMQLDHHHLSNPDTSDLTPRQMDSMEEWMAFFERKYTLYGRLVPEGDHVQLLQRELDQQHKLQMDQWKRKWAPEDPEDANAAPGKTKGH